MSKQTEALKLALEALEYFYLYAEGRNEEKMADKAITAIREALAEQPAQQQEPVACKTLCELCVKRGYHFCANAAQTTPIPSPPASKPWVGLTDEEQQAAYDAWQQKDDGWGSFYDLIEAKLREKNA